MRVKTYCINKGQPSQYYGICTAKENKTLRTAPNNWKTEQGALRWALKHGYEVKGENNMNQEKEATENMEKMKDAREIAAMLEALPQDVRKDVQNMVMGAITAAKMLSEVPNTKGGAA